MVQLLIVIATAVAVAMVLNKRTEDVLPSVVMVAALMLYALGIVLGSLKSSIYIVLAVYVIVAIICVAVSVKQRRIKIGNIVSPAMIVCIVTCVVFAVLFGTHKVIHWDDLSYWGTYAKNLLFIDKIPYGVENCTIVYKDYNPIMQITEYFFLFGQGTYNESYLYVVNVCFLYVIMLPFLSGLMRVKNRLGKAVCILMYLIFPHIFTTQFYYKLGLDYLISVLFGYGLWIICDKEEDNEWIRIVKLVITSSFLATIKTSGVVLTLFLTLFYAVYKWDGKNRLEKWLLFIKNGIMAGLIPMLLYASWKVWSRRTGNHGYLSDKVEGNVRTLAHLFPPYTREVTLNYIKHVFTGSLTRETIGITAAIMIVLIAVAFHFRQNNAADKRLHVFMCVGIVVFCLAHLYMYLFVFEEWEADGLLEFDRYINQYLAGVFFLYMSDIWERGAECAAHRTFLRGFNPAWVIVALLVALLPYPAMKQYLIPANYDELYESIAMPSRQRAIEEWNESDLKGMKLPRDEDHRVMLLADGWSDELQFLNYEMVPQPIAIVVNLPALEAGQLAEFVFGRARDNGTDYVYIAKDAIEKYPGDFTEESRELRRDGTAVEPGRTYRMEMDGDNVWLDDI